MSALPPGEARLFYDDRCPWCRATARVLAGALARRGVRTAPLWRGWSMERLGLGPGEQPPDAPVLETPDRVLAGADAMRELASRIWWLRALRRAAAASGAAALLRRLHRHSRCRTHRGPGATPAR